MPLPLLAIGAGIGLAKTIQGIIQKNKAANNVPVRPELKVNDRYYDNEALAESQLANGLSADTERIYNQQNDKNLSGSIDAILKAGGSANSISDIYSNSQDGLGKLSLMSEQMRLNNLQNVINARNQTSQEEQKAWQVDKYAPYMDKLQANTLLAQQGNANIWSGISDIAGGAASFFNQKQQDNLFGKFFGQGGAGAQSASIPNSGNNTYNIPNVPTMFNNINYASQLPQNTGFNPMPVQQPQLDYSLWFNNGAFQNTFNRR